MTQRFTDESPQRVQISSAIGDDSPAGEIAVQWTPSPEILRRGASMLVQVLRKDDEHPAKTIWINETTGELVTVVGYHRYVCRRCGHQCPEGCRDMTREEVDDKVMHFGEYAKIGMLNNTTWFGRILDSLGVPPWFFPRRWRFRRHEAVILGVRGRNGRMQQLGVAYVSSKRKFQNGD